MRVVEDVQSTVEEFPHVVLTVGSFDGVHLGHQRILAELVRHAREKRGTAAVMTMSPHPREFFSPDHAPNLLSCDSKKQRLLAEAGVDVLFVLEFNREVAGLEPRGFVEQIVLARCQAEELIVGHDFRFGKNGLGDYHFLAELGAELGFEVRQVPPLVIDGERVSSTAVRERLLQGDLAQAEAFLGRKYSVTGDVIPGRGIGAKLGFPTANVRPHHSAVPTQGVYAAEVRLGDATYPAAVNIGIAPTIRDEDVMIEAFLLDFHQDIQGREIEVIFHKRLRPEKKFRSYEELSAAIHKDVDNISKYFKLRTSHLGLRT